MGVQVNDDSVYRKHRDDLLQYAAALVGPHRAEDVLSAVVLRVLARGGFERLSEPRPYLFRSVLNEARNTVRRDRSVPLEVDPVANASLAPDADVLDAVLALPPRQRAAVYLVYWVGLTPTEASVELGARPATIRRYLVIARRKLRRFLDE